MKIRLLAKRSIWGERDGGFPVRCVARGGGALVSSAARAWSTELGYPRTHGRGYLPPLGQAMPWLVCLLQVCRRNFLFIAQFTLYQDLEWGQILVSYSSVPSKEMHSLDSTESQENKINLPAKCYLHWEVSPEPLTLLPCMILSKLIPLFARSHKPLDPYIFMFC